MKDWKKIIQGIAPTLATALGGPLAGTATKFLADTLLGDENAGEAALEAAILNASPDELARIKQIDNDFDIKMKSLDIDVFDLEVKDRQSARNMAKLNMWPQIILSVIFLGGYFGIIYMLFSGHVKMTPEIEQMGTIMLGVITGAIPTILQFWFGSTHGSHKKTDIMNK